MSSQLARAQHSAQLARKKSTDAVHGIIQRVAGGGTAATLAYGDGIGKDGKPRIPVMVGKVPSKLIAAGLGYLAAWFTKGAVSSAAAGFADACNYVYDYKAATGGSMVAGETTTEDEQG